MLYLWRGYTDLPQTMTGKRISLDLTPKVMALLECLHWNRRGDRVFVGSDKDTPIEQVLFDIDRKL